MTGFDHRHRWINGIRMHTAEIGSGEPLVLLHGFPERWRSWRRVMELLAPSYRAIAPDLRGYGDTEAAESGYDLPNLARDVAELLSQAGGGAPVSLAGHDWGGVIGWHVAASYPSLVKKYVAVSGPHLARYRELALKSPMDLARGSYTIFFQLPLLPELLLSAGGGAFLERVARASAVRSDTVGEEDLEFLREGWADRKRMSLGLAYYRELITRFPLAHRYYREHKPECPALVVWGDGDWFLSLGQTRELDKWCASPPEVRIIEDCGHWVPLEAPEELSGMMAEFLGRPEGG